MPEGLLVAAVVVGTLVAAVVLLRREARADAPQPRAVSPAPGTPVLPRVPGRPRRRRELDVRPLDDGARDRYAAEWDAAERDFGRAPARALQQADDIVERVLRDRGYPVEDYDQQTGVISLDLPPLVDDYRAAHDVAEASRADQATAEEMGVAMARYRSLVAELLDDSAEQGSLRL